MSNVDRRTHSADPIGSPCGPQFKTYRKPPRKRRAERVERPGTRENVWLVLYSEGEWVSVRRDFQGTDYWCWMLQTNILVHELFYDEIDALEAATVRNAGCITA